MGREDDGAVFPEGSDQPADLDALVRVEPLGRLVQHQQIGAVQDRLRQADALAEPLRELGDRPVVDAFDPGRRNRGVQRLPAGQALELPQIGDEGEVIVDQHVFVQRVVLGEVPDAALRGPGRVGERDPVERDRTGVGLVVLRDHAHGRGLARPIRTEEAHHLTAVDGKRDMVDRGNAAELLGNVADRQERHTRRDAKNPCGFVQAPGRGRFLQRLEEGDERRAVGGRKPLEPVAGA